MRWLSVFVGGSGSGKGGEVLSVLGSVLSISTILKYYNFF